ncbi:hypothetical protein AX15_002871 [Amanita polypyramis BW_CC]|nr:hypothetical protein AX15_002871 [Amanita polypyramis BW_CC]
MAKGFCSQPDPSAGGDVPPGAVLRAAVKKQLKWKNGSIVTVAFVGIRTRSWWLRRLRRIVMSYALTWTRYANIRLVFRFFRPWNAMIRITFTGDKGGSSSSIGTNCKRVRSGPTMRLGIGLNSTIKKIRRVTLHEFGHALGLVHEHNRPDYPIRWNKEAVYQAHPNWSKEKVKRNIFNKYDPDELQASTFDPNSIMIYRIPPEWTYGTFSTEWNTELSRKDKSFIAKLYPRRKRNRS